MKPRTVLLSIFGTMLWFTASAQVPVARELAAEYVFNVPVKISSIGPGYSAHVICVLQYDRDPRDPQGKFRDTLARQSAAVPFDRLGNYTGTIPIRIAYTAASTGPTANLVPNAYECVLDFDQGKLPHSKTRPQMMQRGSL